MFKNKWKIVVKVLFDDKFQIRITNWSCDLNCKQELELMSNLNWLIERSKNIIQIFQVIKEQASRWEGEIQIHNTVCIQNIHHGKAN